MKTSVTPVQISNLLKWSGWVLLFLFLWLKGCGSDCGKTTTNVKVTVPEVKGSFKPKQPNHKPLVQNLNTEPSSLTQKVFSKGVHDNSMDSSNVDSSNVDSLVNALLSENEQLSRDFYFASDSLKKLKYDKAIQLNLFSESFEDNNIKIDMSGIVRGEVKSIQPFYTIKEREIKTDIRQKEVKFRMLAGGSVGNSVDFQKPVFSANIGFQNKKGGVFRAGYDTEKQILIGYDFSIFSIKK